MKQKLLLKQRLLSLGHLTAASSGFQSIAFDIGGCLGSIIAGFLADRTGASALTCIVFLALAIPSVCNIRFNLSFNFDLISIQ